MTERLELSILVVIEELASGDFLAWPFARPSYVAIGRSRDSVLEQQELFWNEELTKLPGDALAPFDPHGEPLLRRVELTLPLEELPKAAQLHEPHVFPCALLPGETGLWAVVLNLRHALWLEAGLADEAVETRLREEIARICAARDLSNQDLLELLRGADRYELVRHRLRIERDERASAKSRAALRRRRARERSEAEARKLLAKVGSSLLAEARSRRQPPILHREREIATLDAILCGPERLALMLVGPELAGKSAIVHGLAQRWLAASRGSASDTGYPEIVVTSGAQLVAGQSGFGQLEQRVHDVMAAAEALDAVLYFDNLADLFARTSGELGDVAAGMRPWLDRRRVRIIGELTPELLEHHEKRHVGFFANLNRLGVEPLGPTQTREILLARAGHDRRTEPHRPTLSLPPQRDAATPLVDLAERYFSYQAFPGKALRFYASLRAIHEGELTEQAEPKPIGPDEVYRGFSIHSGIPMFLLREDRKLELQRILDFFAARLIGQGEAIRRVAEALCTVKAGLQPGAKPLATFLFVGPTGVGKTEVAKTLARFLFGAPERVARFDMSEYMDPLAADRLIRGTDRDDGVLTRKVRQQPFCVLLLDEIEKAHPAVFDLLLQVCGEGRLSDARGRTTWFHNAIIIMTSNLGAAHQRPSSGFAAAGQGFDPHAAERHYLEQVDTHFRPEFVNRIDRVIPFHPLDRAQIRQVAAVALDRVREREGLGERGIELRVDEHTLERLARQGYSDSYGARALRRELEDQLIAPLARSLARLGGRSHGASVDIAEASAAPQPEVPAGRQLLSRELHDGLSIELTAPTGRRARRTLGALEWMSTLRRAAATACNLPAIVELRERQRSLVAELGHSAHRRRKLRSASDHAAELTRLQGEHGRITAVLDRLDEQLTAIADAEELTITAAYEGEDPELFQHSAQEARGLLRRALIDALLFDSERNAAIVQLHEQDSRRALALFLLPLLRDAADRGWRLSFHIVGDSGPEWPAGRRWGPPRSAEWMAARLHADLEQEPLKAGEKPYLRRWREVLMCVKGRRAGELLRHLDGLFRYDARCLPPARRDDKRRPTDLHVRPLFHDRAELNADDWQLPELSKARQTLPPHRLESAPKQVHFDEHGQLGGAITSHHLALEPAAFWSGLETILFGRIMFAQVQPPS